MWIVRPQNTKFDATLGVMLNLLEQTILEAVGCPRLRDQEERIFFEWLPERVAHDIGWSPSPGRHPPNSIVAFGTSINLQRLWSPNRVLFRPYPTPHLAPLFPSEWAHHVAAKNLLLVSLQRATMPWGQPGLLEELSRHNDAS